MAPELRTRKKSEAAAATPKALHKTKTTKATKRKADDEASPVVKKKVKPQQKPAKKRVASDAPVEDDDEEDEDEDEDDSKALALAETFDNGEDDDEEVVGADAGFENGQDVGKAPTPSKAVQKAAKAGKGAQEESGVVYVGRIPHGFFEHQMKSYFEQFGPIINLRLSRNKKTGASKHYAFIEFAEESTAEIVAKTMDNYLLFGHILKCKLVPKSQVHEGLWKGANRRWKKWDQNKRAAHLLKKPKTESQWAENISKENKKRADRATKLKAMGYDFESPQLSDIPAPKEAPELENKTAEEAKLVEAAPAAAATTEQVEEAEVGATKNGQAQEDEIAGETVKSGKKNGATKAKKGKQSTKKAKA